MSMRSLLCLYLYLGSRDLLKEPRQNTSIHQKVEAVMGSVLELFLVECIIFNTIYNINRIMMNHVESM